MSNVNKGGRAVGERIVFERFEPAARPIPLAQQPVGPPLVGREGLEFIAAIANLVPAALRTTGEPNARNDLSHVEGVCYGLCRFTQAAGSVYERMRADAYRDPAGTLCPRLAPLQALVEAVADRQNFRLVLNPGPEIVVLGRQLHERKPRKRPALPFFFWSRYFEQALVVTAVFYLGLLRESRLLQRCAEKDCRKIFVAMRETRIFCSTTCAGRASTRTFRERQRQRRAGGTQTDENNKGSPGNVKGGK